MQSGRRISWGKERWLENRMILEAFAVCLWKIVNRKILHVMFLYNIIRTM